LDKNNARKIIINAVKTTEPLWKNFGEKWEDIDYVFLSRAYEQMGFHLYKFVNLLNENQIYSIESIGSILDRYQGERKYKRDFAGSINSPFYQDLNSGKYGINGQKFYICARDFKGGFGSGYWMQLWRMLICCHDLKEKYHSSFSFYLKSKYKDFKGLNEVTDDDFINMSIKDWEGFLSTHPWNELYGVGENVFHYILRDIEELKFVKDSEKLDSANMHFLIVTGIMKENEINRNNLENLLKSLELPYTISEINKGLYSYCAETAADSYGFCRNLNKCPDCAVNEICEKKI